MNHKEAELIFDRYGLNIYRDFVDYNVEIPIAEAIERLEKRIIALKETLELLKDGEGPVHEIIDQTLRDDGKMARK
jgi:hypothetical protein